jgi:hypothetical protein
MRELQWVLCGLEGTLGGVTKMKKELAAETRLDRRDRVKWKARCGPCARQPHQTSVTARAATLHLQSPVRTFNQGS